LKEHDDVLNEDWIRYRMVRPHGSAKVLALLTYLFVHHQTNKQTNNKFDVGFMD
jgi:hypothetical protein